MLCGELEKQPGEKLQVVHDFSPEMDEDETISSVTLTITKLSDASDATSTLLITGSGTIDGQTYAYGLQSGTAGEDYEVQLRAVTSRLIGVGTYMTLEAEHFIQVKER